MKLALAVPSYGPLDPHIDKHLRVAMMTASNHGITWAGDVSSIRMGWADGRDRAARAAIETDADGVFWMDDDIFLPAAAIVQLASHGKDFASGMYFQKFPPHWPLVAMFDGKTFQWLREYPEGDHLVEVDGVGFGCAYTSTKLLRALKDKHGKVFEWTKYSEDFTFCLRAGELGMRPWVDTGIKCAHSPLDPKQVTEQDYIAARKVMVEGEAAALVRIA